MPNRIIKESITTSATLAKLSDSEERHFWRLIVQADDFGYLDARPEVIRARAYPMMLDTVSLQEAESRTQALVGTGLLHLFTFDGKRYGHFPTWDNHQQKRAKYSKYPQVESCDIHCNHVLAYVPETLDIRSETLDIRSEKRDESADAPFVLPEWVNQSLWESFLEMRKKARAAPTQRAIALLVKDMERLKAEGNNLDAVLEQSIKNNWKGLFEIKNGGSDGKFRSNAPSDSGEAKIIYRVPEGWPLLGSKPKTML